MTIPASAKGTPIPKPNSVMPFVNPQSGTLTTHGIELLTAYREFIVGMNRIIPCSASGTNVITLTPNSGACPLIEKYLDYEVFIAVAANDSTGPVTATVVPRTGMLPTLKVYKASATQADAGDVLAGELYMFIFNDALDTAAGGFVLK